MSFYFDKTHIATINETLSYYNDTEFESPTRSTVPLLSLLKHDMAMVHSILSALGKLPDYNIHIEYTVKPPTGTGKASHTDIMAIMGDTAIAIEAKWTEPPYEKVNKWLTGRTNPTNRNKVLKGWLSLLQQHTQHNLQQCNFKDAIYQMVHRAASACEVGTKPILAYMVFTPSSDPQTASVQQIKDDLTYLYNLLNRPNNFPFYLVEVNMSPTPEFNKIVGLSKGTQTTAEKVITALKSNNKLFDFNKFCITRI